MVVIRYTASKDTTVQTVNPQLVKNTSHFMRLMILLSGFSRPMKVRKKITRKVNAIIHRYAKYLLDKRVPFCHCNKKLNYNTKAIPIEVDLLKPIMLLVTETNYQ